MFLDGKGELVEVGPETNIDEFPDATRIDTVEELEPWLNRVRASRGFINDGPAGVQREFVIGKRIYVLLRWSRCRRDPDHIK